MAREVNVLALFKGPDQYVYVYDDDGHADMLQTFRDHAADPTLSLTWFDVNVLTQKARDQMAAGVAAAPSR